ncbi:MAG: 30S ribosomal protein S20 [Thermoanaerobaculia bacterium]
MANTPSARKRVRLADDRRQHNRAYRSRMRTAVKKLRAAIQTGDANQARELLPGTLSVVDATAGKGAIHRNAADRTKSRLTRAVQSLG